MCVKVSVIQKDIERKREREREMVIGLTNKIGTCKDKRGKVRSISVANTVIKVRTMVIKHQYTLPTYLFINVAGL